MTNTTTDLGTSVVRSGEVRRSPNEPDPDRRYCFGVDFDVALGAYATAVERRAATVLVGAGLSRGAGYPDWAALLKPFFTEFGSDPAQFTDLPMLAQMVVNADSGSRSRLIDHVVTAINVVPPTPTQNHLYLAQLPVDEIWTTNYDQLIETADPSVVSVETDGDFVEPWAGRKRLNKMHGSIRQGDSQPMGGPSGLVITRDDYDNYQVEHPRAWQLIRAHFMTKSFLFLGFSMSDPNFNEASGRRVLLLDDTFTTGATLHSAAHALVEAGADVRAGVVVARKINPSPRWPNTVEVWDRQVASPFSFTAEPFWRH